MRYNSNVNFKTFTFILLLCPLSSLYGQTVQRDLPWGLFPAMGQTTKQLVSIRSLEILGVGSAAILSIANPNREKAYNVQLEAGIKNENLCDSGNFYGTGFVEIGLSLGGWGVGKIAHSEKWRAFGFEAGTSLAETTALAWILKTAVHRTRPDGGPYSFPSGHCATAFSIVPAAWKYGGWKAGIPATLAGVITGLGRMEDNRHYLSDCLAGATLGLLCGTAACGSFSTAVPRMAWISGRPALEWKWSR